MSVVNIENLTFAYDGSYDNVFTNVSLRFDTSWRLGLTGRNGRGKTTLLRLLTGQYRYSGYIATDAAFEYFPYTVKNPLDCCLHIAESMNPHCPLWQLERELRQLDMDPEVLQRPFCTLSCGEQTKLLLALLFLKDNSFLLIDEPTNHLDMAGRQLLGKYLRSKEGFLLVSHDRAFLDSCVDHMMAINKTGIEIQSGNFSSWQHNMELRQQFELKENQRLKNDIKRLELASAQSGAWSDRVEKSKYSTRNSGLRPDRGFVGHKAAKMMKRSKSLEQRRQTAIEEKSLLLRDVEEAEALKLSPLRYHSNKLAELSHVTIAYSPHQPVCSDISFCIRQGDRIALQGKNGCGKSSILKLLCGMEIPHLGKAEMGSRLKISYLPQDFSQLRGSVWDYADTQGVDRTLFLAILRKLGFERVQFEKQLEELSGGQQKKVLLARSLCQQAHLYIWDEPLNFIDLYSRIQVEELLLEYQPTLLFVEHDRAFCEKVATKTILL
ncbi:MAG: ABC-F type ribosomal protection protein [Angelakisella sp.]|nr:ABC-F type ribosomal protection protein [Angelakisella sp.]